MPPTSAYRRSMGMHKGSFFQLPRGRVGHLLTGESLWMLLFGFCRTGSPWRDIPSEFGPWRTIYGLFNDWNSDGTLDSILDRLRAACIDTDQIDEDLWCIDGSIVSAVAVRRAVKEEGNQSEPADHALGRSRGGFSTKIHLLCDRHGHPLVFASLLGRHTSRPHWTMFLCKPMVNCMTLMAIPWPGRSRSQ